MNSVARFHKRLASAAAIHLPALAVFLAVTVPLSPAASWGGCHCFQDRSFDPSHPAAADSYVLATARNSLLAAVSETDRSSIVKRRMAGTTETDLWLTLYLEGEWGRLDRNSGPFRAAHQAGDRNAMAAVLADGALGRTFRIQQEILTKLRASGADTAQITLSLLISSRTRPDAMEVFTRVRSGETTWGKALSSIGIDLETTGDLIEAQVKRAKESRSEF